MKFLINILVCWIPTRKLRSQARTYLLAKVYGCRFVCWCIDTTNFICAKILNKKRYDTIYSIGHNCSCAFNLKRFNLRNTSGVLDWLWHPTLPEVFDVLCNDFKDFLIKEDLVKLEKNPVQTNHDTLHDYYYNPRNNYQFLHDFPTDCSLDDCFDEVKEKYDKRIERFLNDMHSNKDILLVYLMLHDTFSYTDTELIQMCNSYCDHIGRKVDFLFIENTTTADGAITKKQIQDNITKISLFVDTKDNMNGPTKQMSAIFSKYMLKHFKYNLKR
jgi:hypothetical protein